MIIAELIGLYLILLVESIDVIIRLIDRYRLTKAKGKEEDDDWSEAK